MDRGESFKPESLYAIMAWIFRIIIIAIVK